MNANVLAEGKIPTGSWGRHLIEIVIIQIPQFYLIPAVSAASENLILQNHPGSVLHVQLGVY